MWNALTSHSLPPPSTRRLLHSIRHSSVDWILSQCCCIYLPPFCWRQREREMLGKNLRLPIGQHSSLAVQTDRQTDAHSDGLILQIIQLSTVRVSGQIFNGINERRLYNLAPISAWEDPCNNVMMNEGGGRRRITAGEGRVGNLVGGLLWDACIQAARERETESG